MGGGPPVASTGGPRGVVPIARFADRMLSDVAAWSQAVPIFEASFMGGYRIIRSSVEMIAGTCACVTVGGLTAKEAAQVELLLAVVVQRLLRCHVVHTIHVACVMHGCVQFSQLLMCRLIVMLSPCLLPGVAENILSRMLDAFCSAITSVVGDCKAFQLALRPDVAHVQVRGCHNLCSWCSVGGTGTGMGAALHAKNGHIQQALHTLPYDGTRTCMRKPVQSQHIVYLHMATGYM